MSKTRIITDSGCDIPIKTKLKNTDILNFYITVDGKSYEERKDFTPKEYCKLLEQSTDMPMTAHVSMMRYGEKYEALANDGVTDIIVVTICKSASANYNAALSAKDMFFEEHPDSKVKITVIDSNTYSMGYGYPIMCADDMIEKGLPADRIINYLQACMAHCEIVVSAYTLKYIKKSGRLSGAAAFAGEALGLKPIITLIGDTTTVVQKVRGEKNVLPAITEQVKQRTSNPTMYIIGYTDKGNAKDLADLCEKEIGYPPLAIFELGSTVVTHIGNKTIGIIYVGK